MNFGENLYNLRKKSKMSQEALAEKIGVSRQSVSKWETGSAYPEMNRILELCKIFHCELNDLVNDSILDFDSLDEEIKMNVVKFNKEKQKKLKVTSKIIAVIGDVIKAVSGIAVLVGVILMFLMPTMVKNLEVSEKNIFLKGNELTLSGDYETVNQVIDVLSSHSDTEIIIYGEIVAVCIIASMVLLYFAARDLSKLFKNINKGDTPFTLDNLNLIKRFTILMVTYLVIPEVTGLLFQFITQINMNIEIEIVKILFVLIMICVYYVFDYGHQIQLDSKGKIYGVENE